MPEMETKEAELDATAMNEMWDLSNSEYAAILERQRKAESARASSREERRRQRNLWQRFVDTFAPA